MASCFRGAFPPVDLRAVCFVRAMFDHNESEQVMAQFLSNGFIPGGLLSDWLKIKRCNWLNMKTVKYISRVVVRFRSEVSYEICFVSIERFRFDNK